MLIGYVIRSSIPSLSNHLTFSATGRRLPLRGRLLHLGRHSATLHRVIQQQHQRSGRCLQSQNPVGPWHPSREAHQRQGNPRRLHSRRFQRRLESSGLQLQRFRRCFSRVNRSEYRVGVESEQDPSAELVLTLVMRALEYILSATHPDFVYVYRMRCGVTHCDHFSSGFRPRFSRLIIKSG